MKSDLKTSKKIKNKIPVTFNEEQIRLIEEYQGIMGDTKAEIIRGIVINWLLNNKNDKK